LRPSRLFGFLRTKLLTDGQRKRPKSLCVPARKQRRAQSFFLFRLLACEMRVQRSAALRLAAPCQSILLAAP
jgi:hypothetical protein